MRGPPANIAYVRRLYEQENGRPWPGNDDELCRLIESALNKATVAQMARAAG